MPFRHRNCSEKLQHYRDPDSTRKYSLHRYKQIYYLHRSQTTPSNQTPKQISKPRLQSPNSRTAPHTINKRSSPFLKPTSFTNLPLGIFARHLPPTNPSAVPSSALQTPSGNLPHQDKSSCQARRRGSIIRTILKLWENCGG